MILLRYNVNLDIDGVIYPLSIRRPEKDDNKRYEDSRKKKIKAFTKKMQKSEKDMNPLELLDIVNEVGKEKFEDTVTGEGVEPLLALMEKYDIGYTELWGTLNEEIAKAFEKK